MKSGDMTFTGASAPRVRLGMQRSAAWAMARGAFSVRACWPSALARVLARVRGSARSWRGAELRARRAAMPGERRCPASERRGYTHHRDARGGSLRRWLDQGAEEREYNSKTVREWKRLEISSRLYSLFRIVCDHVQFTWYTCSCGQIFNFFVAIKESGLRVHPDAASPALRPPLRARAWRTNTNTADRAHGAGRAHASSVRPHGRCTHRAVVCVVST